LVKSLLDRLFFLGNFDLKVYVHKNGQQSSPFTVEQLRQYVQQGNFTAENLDCHDGQNWVKIAEVPGFAESTQPAAPPDGLSPHDGRFPVSSFLKSSTDRQSARLCSSVMPARYWSTLASFFCVFRSVIRDYSGEGLN
jgi:hypothetical protein